MFHKGNIRVYIYIKEKILYFFVIGLFSPGYLK